MPFSVSVSLLASAVPGAGIGPSFTQRHQSLFLCPPTSKAAWYAHGLLASESGRALVQVCGAKGFLQAAHGKGLAHKTHKLMPASSIACIVRGGFNIPGSDSPTTRSQWRVLPVSFCAPKLKCSYPPTSAWLALLLMTFLSCGCTGADLLSP